MTSFKDKLDKELGEAPRFSQSLQERIMQNVKQQKPQPSRWQYPTIVIGAVITLLLLIVMGPWKQVDTVKHATIVELAKHEEIKQFTKAQNWEEDSFKAGRAGWILGQQVFNESSEKELLKQILQQAIVTQKDNQDIVRAMDDVWIEFDNGQIVRLKMYLTDAEIVFIDQQTNTFYIVKDEKMVSAYVYLTQENDVNISGKELIIFLAVFIFVGWLVEKLVQSKFNIPNEPKYASSNHRRTVFVAKVINIVFMMIFTIKGWFLYTAATCTFLAVSIFSSIIIDYYYGREEKRHYVSIISAIVMLLFFIAFITYIH